MSVNIDQRVVEMRFDNKRFESNASTTISTLEKLKQSLNLSGATKGLDEVSSAARRCDVSAVGRAAETVGLKFNAMFTIADQALRNITNSAMNAGKRIVSALTIDPIKTGFSEYETQINAIQTILANTESKGTTLDDVNGALDELNTYADKTIYNFTEMTRNIGTFTAAGTDLDTSVKAIKGIANLAAVSGSTSQQASTAMYQLSQAMASGTVKLMDWNSVVNAGMGGQVFQDALKETAKVHGVAIDDIIAKNGSFRESLSEGWLTTEILTDTLEKFTMYAEEGSKEWEEYKKTLMSKGYSEKQAEEILKMGKTATEAATKVKTFTQLFDTLKEAAQSGWTQTWEILVGDFEEAKELLTTISDTVGGFINKMSESRNELLENWKVMGGRQDLIDSFKNVFEGLVSVITPIKDAFGEIFSPVTAEQLVKITKTFKEFTAKLKLSDEGSNNLKRTFKGLFAVVDIIKQVFVSAFKAVTSLFGAFGNLGGGILGATASFGDCLVAVRDFITSSGVIDKVFQGVSDVINAALKGASGFVKFIKTKFVVPGFEAFQALLENIRSGMSGVGETASGVKGLVVSAFEHIGNALESCSFVKILQGAWNIIQIIGSGISKVFGNLVTALGNTNFDGILGIVNSLVSGGLLVSIIKFVNNFTTPLTDLKESAEGLIENLKNIFGEVGNTLKTFQDQVKSKTLMNIAIAVGILAAALIVLSFIDTEKLFVAMGAITTLFAELFAMMSLLAKIDTKTVGVKIGAVMIELSVALLILAAAMKIISTLSWEELGVGLIGIAVGLGALVGAVNLLPETKVKSAAAAIKKMSTALLIMSVALKIMGTMSWEEMGVGLISTVVGLGALVAAANLLPKDMALKSLGIVSLSTAMLILSGALKIMSTMSWKELGISLAALAGTLTVLTIAMNLMQKALPGAAAVTIVAPALIVLAGAIRLFGAMSLSEIGKGLLALGGSLGILAIGLNVLKGTISGSAALLVAAISLGVLTPVLLALGSMSWGSIAKGLITIGSAFAIIGLAGVLLKPAIPSILALAASLAFIGVGVLTLGAGLIAIGTGLSAIGVGIVALVGSLSAVATGIIDIIVTISVGLAEGIVAFCGVIAEGAPVIGSAIKALVLELCDVIVECVPIITDAALQLIFGLLSSLSKYTPQIIDVLFDFIIGLIDGLADRAPELITSLVNLFSELFKALGSALGGFDTGDLLKGVVAVGILAKLVDTLASVNIKSIPKAMLGMAGVGALMVELTAILVVIGGLARIPEVQSLISDGGDLLGKLSNAVIKSVPLIAAVAVLMAVSSSISGLIGPAAIGLAGISVIIAELAALIAVFGIIAQDKTLVWLIDEGGELLVKLATIIGRVVGALVGAVIGGITEGFSVSLVILGSAIRAFYEEVKGIKSDILKDVSVAAIYLSVAVAAMTASGMLLGLNAVGSLVNTGLYLAAVASLGAALAAFSWEVQNVDPEIINAASKAAIYLSAAVAVMSGAGFLAGLSGVIGIVGYTAAVVTIGGSLWAFYNEVQNVNPEVIKAASSAANNLSVAVGIMSATGFLAGLTGILSVPGYFLAVATIGEAMSIFNDNVAGIDPGVVKAAADASGPLNTAVLKMTGTGVLSGLAAILTCGLSVVSYVASVEAIGEALRTFNDVITKDGGVNVTQITSAANAAEPLTKAVLLMTGAGFLNALSNILTLGGSNASYKSAVKIIGEAISEFSKKVKDISPSKVEAAAYAADKIADVVATVPVNSEHILTFGDNLTDLGTNMALYYTTVSNIASESVKASSTIVESINDLCNVDSGKIKSLASAIGDVVQNLNDFKKTLSNLGETSVKTFLNTFKDLGSDLKKLAKKAMDSFIDGVEDKKSKATKAFEKIAEDSAEAIGDKKKAFEKVGKNVVQGFADGISSNSFIAEAKAKAMAEAALEAARKALKVNSPSKVFRDLGYSVPEGFALGIDKLSGIAEDSAESMANGSFDTVRDTISRLGSIIDSDIDVQPTISPVLDLSDVKSGANSISKMLDLYSSVGVMANVGAINSIMAQRSQNGVNDDVVSAIDKLSKHMDENRGDTYNFGNVSYDDESSISNAVQSLVRALMVDKRR